MTDIWLTFDIIDDGGEGDPVTIGTSDLLVQFDSNGQGVMNSDYTGRVVLATDDSQAVLPTPETLDNLSFALTNVQVHSLMEKQRPVGVIYDDAMRMREFSKKQLGTVNSAWVMGKSASVYFKTLIVGIDPPSIHACANRLELMLRLNVEIKSHCNTLREGESPANAISSTRTLTLTPIPENCRYYGTCKRPWRAAASESWCWVNCRKVRMNTV